MKKEYYVDNLRVVICDDRSELGRVAAEEAAVYLREALGRRCELSAIFAAAPSQNEFLSELAKKQGVEWQKLRAFHMDEYADLPEDAPQRFGRFLYEHFFSLVTLRDVHYLSAERAGAEERYAELLKKYPADVCFMGIGENGHIAFNDPPVADMFDPETVKRVTLDLKCRCQQVHDGCFKTLEDVPLTAVTLTVPALMRAGKLFCMVPGKTKAEAVRAMLCGPVDMSCPASVLRLHKDATLYLDMDSSEFIR